MMKKAMNETTSHPSPETDIIVTERRYPERVRKVLVRFMINAQTRVRDEDEPTMREALNGDDKKT